MKALIKAKKLNMSQIFLDDGTVVPVTWIEVISSVSLDSVKTVDIIGVSKGRGFQGVVKRYNFAGDLATHGRSDKHRAVGSIGSETHVSRVIKGKKMPGRFGGKTINLRARKVVKVEGLKFAVVGAVPGSFNSNLKISLN